MPPRDFFLGGGLPWLEKPVFLSPFLSCSASTFPSCSAFLSCIFNKPPGPFVVPIPRLVPVPHSSALGQTVKFGLKLSRCGNSTFPFLSHCFCPWLFFPPPLSLVRGWGEKHRSSSSGVTPHPRWLLLFLAVPGRCGDKFSPPPIFHDPVPFSGPNPLRVSSPSDWFVLDLFTQRAVGVFPLSSFSFFLKTPLPFFFDQKPWGSIVCFPAPPWKF